MEKNKNLCCLCFAPPSLPNMEKPDRHIYNPYLLNVLYQKVLYLDRVKRLFAISRSRITGVDNGIEEWRRVIQENYYSEQMVADVFHLMSTVGDGKFPLDIYQCNYEYILSRMMVLFHPLDEGLLPSDLIIKGYLFATELKCSEVIQGENKEEETENRRILKRLIERYVLKYYFLDVENYDQEAGKRASILHSIKLMEEGRISSVQQDPHYKIKYECSVVVTLMYVFFMNEFRSMLMSDRALLSLDHKEDSLVMTSLDAKIKLCTTLYQALKKQYENEFQGFSVIEVHPECDGVGEQTTPSFLYKQAHPPIQSVTYTTKGDSGLLIIREKPCNHIKYISLKKNYNKYIRIVDRMMFDHGLIEQHQQFCILAQCDSKQRKGGYTLSCQICSYFKDCDVMSTLYQYSSSYTYNDCQYFYAIDGGEKDEDKLMAYLGGVVVDRVYPVTSLLYKNAWQLMNFFYVLGGGDGGEDRIKLFHIINLPTLVDYVHKHYHDVEKRVANLLSQKSASHHKNKAILYDIDMLCLIINAVNEQMGEVDKYQRTIDDRGVDVLRNRVVSELYSVYKVYGEIAGINLIFNTIK
jgi:hypothetical protein